MLVSCLVEHDKIKQSHSCFVNIFRYHNQCGGGQCLPNCVQVVLCGDAVINTKVVESLTENEKHPPLKAIVTSGDKKLKLAWANLRV